MLAAESRRVALEKQRADKTLGAQRRQRGHPLYLAVHDLGCKRPSLARPSEVSVRVLHALPRVHCRSISGSFVHGRFSGGNETF